MKPDTLFTIGVAFWIIACVILSILQISFQKKYGRNSDLKEIKSGHLKLAKCAGLSLLLGIIIIITSMIIR